MKEAVRDQLPPAFFAASDSLAIGALQNFQEAKLTYQTVSLISLTTLVFDQAGLSSLSSIPFIPKKWAEQDGYYFNKEVLHGRKIPSLTMLGTRLTFESTSHNSTNNGQNLI